MQDSLTYQLTLNLFGIEKGDNCWHCGKKMPEGATIEGMTIQMVEEGWRASRHDYAPRDVICPECDPNPDSTIYREYPNKAGKLPKGHVEGYIRMMYPAMIRVREENLRDGTFPNGKRMTATDIERTIQEIYTLRADLRALDTVTNDTETGE